MKKNRVSRWWPCLLLLVAVAGCDLFSANQQPVIASGSTGSLNPFTVNPFSAINTAIQGTRPQIEPAAGTLGSNSSQSGSTGSTGAQTGSTGSTPMGSTQ